MCVAIVSDACRSDFEIRPDSNFLRFCVFYRISLRLSENTDIRESDAVATQDDDVEGRGETADFRALRGAPNGANSSAEFAPLHLEDRRHNSGVGDRR
jgi:hypothetical protein